MSMDISKCEQKLINFLKVNGFTEIDKKNLKDIFSQTFIKPAEKSKCFALLRKEYKNFD